MGKDTHKRTAEEIVSSWKKDPHMPTTTPLFAMKVGEEGYQLHGLTDGRYILTKIDYNETAKTRAIYQCHMNFYTLLALRVAIDKMLEMKEG